MYYKTLPHPKTLKTKRILNLDLTKQGEESGRSLF